MISRRLKATDDEIDVRYGNRVKLIIDMIKPKNLMLVAGRGTAKSTDVLAERIIDIIYDMPRAPMSFIADTYVNLLTNVIPFIQMGWERKKFYEDIHYVVDKAPPSHLNFDRPIIPSSDYKHTLSVHNGCKFFLKSLDRASMNAGISVVHLIGDETKFDPEVKMNKAFPTLRGDSLLFGHSPYYLGYTLTTDMPNVNNGEHDWFLKLEENMDKEKVLAALKVAFVLNDLYIELVNAQKNKLSDKELINIQRNIERWQDRYRNVRRDLTLFLEISSFANADILKIEYFKNLFDTLDFTEFKTSVCSIRTSLDKGAMFYGNLADRHFYGDGYNYDYYDRFGFRDNIKQTSEGLKYIRENEPLDAGFDAGNMMSMVFGQEQGNTYRVLKNIYVLTPEWLRELADSFIEFFKPHKHKVLNLYYDRAANAYSKAKQDFASKLKECIEKDGLGKPTGWHVTLMSLGQGNIAHEEEYNLMNDLMGDKNTNLPKLLIDKYECKELKSSLCLAPMEKDSKGFIKKVKKSEKLPIKRLPMESTNMSDAFKYLMCRRKYLLLVKAKRRISVGSVDTH